jgi:ATP:ADP antiporter, AAA family
VFSICVSQRAADGLLLALDDQRFDVRFHCAKSLAAVLARNPRLRIDRDRVLEVVLREVAVGRPVWESRRQLEGAANGSVNDFVRGRAEQSLAHLFTLLSLILPSQPLQIAFQSLHSENGRLRGTALEYLEGVLPAEIRQQVWPFLVQRDITRPSEPQDDVIASLLRNSSSLTFTSS